MKFLKYIILAIFIFNFFGCVENINVVEGDFNSSNEFYYKNLEEALSDGAITKEEYESIKYINKH